MQPWLSPEFQKCRCAAMPREGSQPSSISPLPSPIAVSYIAQACLKLPVQPRLDLNFKLSFPKCWNSSLFFFFSFAYPHLASRLFFEKVAFSQAGSVRLESETQRAERKEDPAEAISKTVPKIEFCIKQTRLSRFTTVTFLWGSTGGALYKWYFWICAVLVDEIAIPQPV